MDWYSNKRATTVIPDGEHTACVYHQTKVVRWNDSEIILDSAGYRSATTKARMNEVSKRYGLGFSVFQKDGKWFVRLPGRAVSFSDGMKIQR